MARNGNKKKSCEKYKLSGRREENKAKRQARAIKMNEKMKKRQERIASGELIPKKLEIPESVRTEKEKVRKQKAFKRLIATTQKSRPFCSATFGVMWGIDG